MIDRTEREIMDQGAGSAESPHVSVCCITYNHEAYISQSIDSVLMQKTDFPFELIIRDDCSKDRTTEIIRSYAEAYPNIIKLIIERENQFSKGVSPFPVVMLQARGKYITQLDGDDYWLDPYKLQMQADYLDRHEEFVGLGCNALKLREADNSKYELFRVKKIDEKTFRQEDLLFQSPLITLTVMFRNHLIDQASMQAYRGKFGDLHRYLLLSEHGDFKYINRIVGVYRVHSASVFGQFRSSAKGGIKELEEYLNIACFWESRLPDYRQKIETFIEKTREELAMMYLKDFRVKEASQASAEIDLQNVGTLRRKALLMLLRRLGTS